jgi:hypothetical protein
MLATMGTGPVAGALAALLALGAMLGVVGDPSASPTGVPSVAAEPGVTIELGDYQWENRLVLIFAPTAQEPAYIEQAAAFADRDAAIVDRHLLIGQFPVDSTGLFAGQTVSVAGNAALREQFGVGAGDFAVLLIGKDGGVKLRSDVPLTADRIFATIDSMPMRQREMR